MPKECPKCSGKMVKVSDRDVPRSKVPMWECIYCGYKWYPKLIHSWEFQLPPLLQYKNKTQGRF